MCAKAKTVRTKKIFCNGRFIKDRQKTLITKHIIATKIIIAHIKEIFSLVRIRMCKKNIPNRL